MKTAPGGVVAEPEGMAPEGMTPEGAGPEGATPEGATPEGAGAPGIRGAEGPALLEGMTTEPPLLLGASEGTPGTGLTELGMERTGVLVALFVVSIDSNRMIRYKSYHLLQRVTVEVIRGRVVL